ncbi:MAG TPA: hypothetical protein VF054_11045 [Micromonosporaceae bacterium]
MSTPNTGRAGWARAAAVLVVAVLVVVLDSGCGILGGTSHPSRTGHSSQKDMDAIADEIQATLAERPDVVRARVVYQNNLNASAQADVNVTVTAGAAFDPVVDEAVKLLWQSRLSPLHSIRVGVVDAGDTQRGTVRYVDTQVKDKADLESRYGPRPVR